MKIDLPYTLEKLSAFLKSIDESKQERLVSFAFRIDDFDLFFTLNQLVPNFQETFLFQSPYSRYSFMALNTALKISNSN